MLSLLVLLNVSIYPIGGGVGVSTFGGGGGVSSYFQGGSFFCGS